MIKVYSFGIVPLVLKSKVWRTFLIQHGKGHWSFAKGHPEKGESPQEAAEREFHEETGLEVVHFYPVSPFVEAYRFKAGNKVYDKTVTYFVAEVKGEVNLQTSEISDARWVTLEEALNSVTFKETKRICEGILELVASGYLDRK